MSIVRIKRSLQSNRIGRIILKCHHYCVSVPIAKYYSIKYFFIKDSFKKISFYSYDETFDLITNHNKSLVRFGDGEIMWIYMKSRGDFGQENSELLSRRLREVIESDNEDVLIGVPNFFGEMPNYDKKHIESRNVHLARDGQKWMPLLKEDKKYADSLITRVYYGHTDRNYVLIFQQWKSVWESKNIVIIEGSQTRFGVGNDLLCNCSSVKRIIAPSENAFSMYTDIFAEAMKCAEVDIFLIALGPTATVLAYDLGCSGKKAIDIGHLDIEYEWYKRGAHKKEPVAGKYVNEAGGKSFEEIASEYLEQYNEEIICRIE